MFQLNIVVIQEKGNKKYMGKLKRASEGYRVLRAVLIASLLSPWRIGLRYSYRQKIPKNVFKQHEEVHKWLLNRILRKNFFTPFILLFLPDKRRKARKARSCK